MDGSINTGTTKTIPDEPCPGYVSSGLLLLETKSLEP